METMPIKIFKTNVKNHKQASAVGKDLGKLLGNNESWNFDLEDCDSILRVDSERDLEDFIEILKINGFECQEL